MPHVDHLFRKNGSANWYVRLQDPTAPKKGEPGYQRGARDGIRSLGTADKAQANVLASAIINEHRAMLLARAPRLEASWAHRLEPGREHAAPNGDGKIVATDRELIHIGHNGGILKIEPNGGPANRLVNMPMGAVIVGDNPSRELRKAYNGAPFINLAALERPAKPTKNNDDTLFETYLNGGGKKKTGVHGYYRREAEATWSLFKRLTKNKPLKDCTRADGRLLVAYYQSEEGGKLKSATIGKKIGWLNAAVHFAIKESQFHSINPFSGIAPDGAPDGSDDKLDRTSLDDADVAECKAKLAALSDADQLLFRLLACSGMRLGEAFQINGEKTQGGIRYVNVGSKTEASKRRVPLPAGALVYLPAAIKGPLFAADTPNRFAKATIKRLSDMTSKRLMRFLRDDCRIKDPAKVIHSLRHRAKDRLRDAECSPLVQYELLGHDDGTVAATYGEGSALRVLRKWIDTIGF